MSIEVACCVSASCRYGGGEFTVRANYEESPELFCVTVTRDDLDITAYLGHSEMAELVSDLNSVLKLSRGDV
jgi:hypothetical protein